MIHWYFAGSFFSKLDLYY